MLLVGQEQTRLNANELSDPGLPTDQHLGRMTLAKMPCKSKTST
jgi:hypothetical protein